MLLLTRPDEKGMSGRQGRKEGRAEEKEGENKRKRGRGEEGRTEKRVRIIERWEEGEGGRKGKHEWWYAGKAAEAVNTITSRGAVDGAGNKSHSREPLTRRAATCQLQPIYGSHVIALQPYLDPKMEFSFDFLRFLKYECVEVVPSA